MFVSGCLGLLIGQVMCEEFRQCYNDVNICLWTDGSRMIRAAAQSYCSAREITFYHASLTVTFSRRWQSFVLPRHELC